MIVPDSCSTVTGQTRVESVEGFMGESTVKEVVEAVRMVAGRLHTLTSARGLNPAPVTVRVVPPPKEPVLGDTEEMRSSTLCFMSMLLLPRAGLFTTTE